MTHDEVPLEETNSSDSMNPKDFFAGTLAGVALTLVGHPFDTIKVRLQAQGSLYKNGFDSLRQTVGKEGILALYKGMGGPMLTVPVVNAIVFAAYGQAKTILQKSQSNEPLSLVQISLAGAYAGLLNTIVVSPVELIKTQLQIQHQQTSLPGFGAKSIPKDAALVFTGPINCIRKIIARNGIKGIFRGMTATVYREVPCYASQFFAYEGLKRLLTREGQKESDLGALQLIVAGGLAGITGWIFSYPMDYVKCWGTGTRLMMYDGSSKKVEDIVRDSRAGFQQNLMGPDSKPRRVLAGTELGPTRGKLWQIELNTSGRQVWTCNEKHILVLATKSPPTIARDGATWTVSWFTPMPMSDDNPCGQRSQMPRAMQQHGFPSKWTAQEFVDRMKWQSVVFECTLRDYLAASVESRNDCLMFQPDVIRFPAPLLSLAQRLAQAVPSGVNVTDQLVRRTAWVLGVWTTCGLEVNSRPLIQREIESWNTAVSGASPTDLEHSGGLVLQWLLQSYNMQIADGSVVRELLTDSIEVRQAVLAGIIDSIGLASNNGFQICNVREDATSTYAFLARSLGLQTTAVPVKVEQIETASATELWIGGHHMSYLQLVDSCKRNSVIGGCPGALSKCNDGFSVKSMPDGSFFGFELDGDGRCLLDDFVVTHNTQLQAEPYDAKSTFRKNPYLFDGGFFNCWNDTVKKDGFRALWKGFGPCAARAFPANAAGFLAYEVGLKMYDKWFQ